MLFFSLLTTPTMAVTDFLGIKILLEDAVSPIDFSALSIVRNFFCISIGKSPYPGLYLDVSVLFSFCTTSSNSSHILSHSSSIAVVAQASSINALVMLIFS